MEGKYRAKGGRKGWEGGKDGEERKRRRCGKEEEEKSPSQPSHYDASSSLLFAVSDDDRSSASGLDVVDRLTFLEQRMQMQEDEIQLLKMALSDVLKRLNISEEQQASRSKTPTGAKVSRPVSLALSSKPTVLSPGSGPGKKSSVCSTSGVSPSNKSTVKSPTGRDSPCGSKTSKSRPTSACKKNHDSSGTKAKDAAVTVGARRVTHCKVTMQIYLSPLTRRTGSFEAARAAPVVLNARNSRAPSAPEVKGTPRRPTDDRTKAETGKNNPALHLPLMKTCTHFQKDSISHKNISPIKSPNQYFQICY